MLSNPFIPEPLLTLDTEELILVNTNNTEKNRLAFALMLKFFQTKGRYPTRKDKIDPMILYSLASQLKVSPALFEPSYLETRISERFRRKIREFTGYKIASLSDSKILIAWLIKQMAQGPFTMPRLREKACHFF